MVVAKDAKLDLSAVLPSDERVVFETRPYPFRQVLRTLAMSVMWVIVIVGILVFVALGRPILSDVPIVSTALNAVYDFVFGDELSARVALLFYLFTISYFILDACSSSYDRVIYFVTNKRIIWWSKRIGKIVNSIPLTSVKMIDLDPPPSRRGRRYGYIVFWSQVESTGPGPRTWDMIRDPESVRRRLQGMTPEPDPLFVRRKHINNFVGLVIAGVVIISMMIYSWTEILVTAEPGMSFFLKMTFEFVGFACLVAIYQGIGDLRQARRITVSIRKRRRGKERKGV